MDIEVDRRNLHRTRIVSEPPAALAPGQSRLAVDRFALTSNNVTYAAFGDMLQYWDFFRPSTTDADDVEWGRVPVWGFADVVESNGNDLAVGARVYGYLPMSEEIVVEPGRIDDSGFTDLSAHRAPMAAAYNRYAFVREEDRPREPHRMVLYPLFFTSFVIDDFIGDHDCFGASLVIVSSASSKTAIGTARLLADRPGLRVVGLTSKANADFVRGLDCYHTTITYESLSDLPDGVAVYVDIAGNGDVRAAVHDHYADRLVYSMIVGGTHWDHRTEAPPSTVGAEPAFFFAPTQIAKRTHEWGAEEMDRRLGAAWNRFAAWVDGWLEFVERRGPEAVDETFAALIRGDVDPRVGFVCSMRPSASTGL